MTLLWSHIFDLHNRNVGEQLLGKVKGFKVSNVCSSKVQTQQYFLSVADYQKERHF